ncbi:hypothetical protein Tdes44962_MAKER01707 [Teratosphaeria destructans]|uniref:Uncharacterized protein n=1 Tax=Teratosphaeria destructans TaxID=418781 RepID=A0A9W7SY86_9PEZI|nr:hypothetical protein Tdes44962_MAKER01707 [Teratosphaeria destructans]
MSLSRALTTSRNRPEISGPVFIGRAASQRAGRPVNRAQISPPMVLVSTTNTLLHNAEHIPGTRVIEIRHVSRSSAASSSGEDSDGSSNASTHSRTNTTLTDASSVDESPSPTLAEPNHLSCYFRPNVDTHSRHSSVHSPSARESWDAPALPKRVPSHSKKAHESLHRKRSVQRMLPPAISARESLRNSAQMHVENSPAVFVEALKEGPFGRELAQLDEVAEEFGSVVRDAETEADMKVIRNYGLAQYAASDYMAEIQGLIYSTFIDDSPILNMGGWI